MVGVTGNALLSDQEEYLEAGVDRYVLYLYVLPFRMNGLIVFKDVDQTSSRAQLEKYADAR